MVTVKPLIRAQRSTSCLLEQLLNIPEKVKNSFPY